MIPEICHINLAKNFRGGERQTFLLIKTLADNNINQTVIVRKHSKLSKVLNKNNINMISVVEINKPFFLNLHK